MVTEFFNTSVRDVYRVGPATYYETFLPTTPVRLEAERRVVDEHGRPVDPRYVLVTCRTPVAGRVVAQGTRGVLELVDVQPPLRLVPARCPRREPAPSVSASSSVPDPIAAHAAAGEQQARGGA
jgi:hypothetical protein